MRANFESREFKIALDCYLLTVPRGATTEAGAQAYDMKLPVIEIRIIPIHRYLVTYFTNVHEEKTRPPKRTDDKPLFNKSVE